MGKRKKKSKSPGENGLQQQQPAQKQSRKPTNGPQISVTNNKKPKVRRKNRRKRSIQQQRTTPLSTLHIRVDQNKPGATIQPSWDLRQVLDRKWQSYANPGNSQSWCPATNNSTAYEPRTVKRENDATERRLHTISAEPQAYRQSFNVSPTKEPPSTEMAVLHRNYPQENLTDMEANIVLGEILQNVLNCPAGQGPQFSNSRISKGVVFLSCANSRTRDWLEKLVKDLKPWYGACLQTCSSRCILPVSRVIVWIPTSLLPGFDDSQKFLKLFENQNEGLSTIGWEIHYMEREMTGVKLMLAVDGYTLDWLRSHYFQAYFGFQKVTFKLDERQEFVDSKPHVTVASSSQPFR